MIAMKANVSFANRALATEHNPSGSIAAHEAFSAPSADVAKTLSDEGLAERVKTDATTT